MNIILSGYGRMGKEVEKIALERGHQILAKINAAHEWEGLQLPIGDEIPVVIDFSESDSVRAVYRFCFDNKLPVVSGTTGWLGHWDEVVQECKTKQATFFYASNFSLGVNIYFSINRKLATIMAKLSGYGPSMSETHHVHKLDAPSGTAITIANQILNEYTDLNGWAMDGETQENKLHISCFREGEVPGTHVVQYESDEDVILLEHRAKNRRGFALGSVLAAEFVKNRKGIYSMQDMMNTILD